MVERHPLAKAVSRTEEDAMNGRDFLYRVGFGISAAFTLTLFSAAAIAADISPDSLKLAPEVVKAPAYETPPTNYIVANSTNIYSDRWLYDTKVTGELKRGEPVEALAKVKGWDWLLVGKNGTGIGYVSISMLAPADKYVP
jgi:hypothetical protein